MLMCVLGVVCVAAASMVAVVTDFLICSSAPDLLAFLFSFALLLLGFGFLAHMMWGHSTHTFTTGIGLVYLMLLLNLWLCCGCWGC